MGILEDGQGSGSKAGVTSNFRMKTDGVNRTQFQTLADSGRGFSVSTAVLTLTSSSESAVAYLSNTGQDTIIVRDISVMSNESKELSGTPNTQQTYLLKIYSLPTAISSGTALTLVPSKASNAKTMTIDIQSGTEGSSFTGGSATSSIFGKGGVPTPIAEGSSVVFLEPGQSFGVSITPPVGTSTANDSMKFIISASLFINQEIL